MATATPAVAIFTTTRGWASSWGKRSWTRSWLKATRTPPGVSGQLQPPSPPVNPQRPWSAPTAAPRMVPKPKKELGGERKRHQLRLQDQAPARNQPERMPHSVTPARNPARNSGPVWMPGPRHSSSPTNQGGGAAAATGEGPRGQWASVPGANLPDSRRSRQQVTIH